MRNRSAANDGTMRDEGAERIRTAGSSPSTNSRQDDALRAFLALCDAPAAAREANDPAGRTIAMREFHDAFTPEVCRTHVLAVKALVGLYAAADYEVDRIDPDAMFLALHEAKHALRLLGHLGVSS